MSRFVGSRISAVKPRVHCENGEAEVDHLAHRQIEGNVADGGGNVDGGVRFADGGNDFCVRLDAVFRCAEHLYKRIDVDAAGRNAVFLRLGHDLVKHLQTIGGVFGNTGIIAQKGDDPASRDFRP